MLPIAFPAALAAAALLVWLRVRRNVRPRLKVRALELDCPALPERPLEILHVSDLHISRRTLWRLEALYRAAGREWDLVLASGDFAEEPQGIEPVARALGALRSRCGIWAVLGNHDYLHYKADTPARWLQVLLGSLRHGRCDRLSLEFEVGPLVESLERHGVRVLRNAVEEGKLDGGGTFQIFGIDDPVTGHDNPRRLYGSQDRCALRLALTHAPTRLGLLRPLEPHLVLCGHTHGGQVRLPWLGAVSTGSQASRRAAGGLVTQDSLRVHISHGAGAGVVFPWRFGAQAEITVLRLGRNGARKPDKTKTPERFEVKP